MHLMGQRRILGADHSEEKSRLMQEIYSKTQNIVSTTPVPSDWGTLRRVEMYSTKKAVYRIASENKKGNVENQMGTIPELIPCLCFVYYTSELDWEDERRSLLSL